MINPVKTRSRDVDLSVSDDEIAECVKQVVTKLEPKPRAEKKVVSEAYVAQAKSYPQVTDHLSERAKQQHERMYKDYCDKLTKTSIALDSADKEQAGPTSQFRSLKSDEQRLHNAVYLHELFFANCFDPHSEVYTDMLAYMRLQRDWGSFDAWMHEFMACAMSARSGWVVCGYSLFLKRMVNVIVDEHDVGALVGLVPALVVDMWEHAYTRDFADEKKGYLVAMMREIAWDVVEDRIERIDAIKEVLK